MCSITAYAKAFAMLDMENECVFSEKDFGENYDEIANGVKAALEGLNCSIEHNYEQDSITIRILQ